MDTPSRTERLARRVGQAAAALAGGSALGIALGEGLGWGSLAPFMPAHLRMAPAPAWLVVLLNAALFLRNRWPERPSVRGAGLVAATIVAVVSLLALACAWRNVPLGWESWLVHPPAAVEGVPVGRRLWHTTVTLLCAAGALASLSVTGRRPWLWRGLAFTLGAVVGCNGLVVTLGYAAGAPWFQGGAFVPMAFSAAIVSTVLGLGLMVTAQPDNWLLEALLGPENVAEIPSRRLHQVLALAFLVLLAGILGMGFAYLRRHLADARLRVAEELSVIAHLKAAQIARWRRERITDANLVLNTPYVARRALDALAEPNSARTRQMFTGWLGPFLATGPYSHGLVLDEQWSVRLVHPATAPMTLGEAARRAVEQAMRTRQVVVCDLHRVVEDGPVFLSLVVPLVVRREGAKDNVPAAGLPPSTADRSAGALVLQLDAHRTLYPQIASWPVPSRTAETLLVRHEGQEVLFLNELRHRTNTALRLRLSATDPRLPSARAVRGEIGVREGRDYRGVPVLAAVLPVPGSPWFLVAKVDQAEMYATLNEQAWVLGTLMMVLALGLTLGLSLVWRQRVSEFLRTQVAAERERGALAERLAHLMKSANDIILLADEQLRIVEANDRALEAYGYSLAELQQLRAMDLRAPEDRGDAPQLMEPTTAEGPGVVEMQHRRKDGSIFPVESSHRRIQIGGATYHLAIVRDITERQRANTERERLIGDLQNALAEVKTLRGLLPICAGCKKIRDEKEQWHPVETYVMRHSEAQFTHGYCPECLRKYFPDISGEA